MKKLLFTLFVMLLLGSCSMGRQYTENAYVIDYTKYRGIFITEANSVSFEYEPVGSIVASIGSGYDRRKYITASADDALYVLCEEARKHRANGIINLKITYEWEIVKNSYGQSKTLTGVVATGMAIKM